MEPNLFIYIFGVTYETYQAQFGLYILGVT